MKKFLLPAACCLLPAAALAANFPANSAHTTQRSDSFIERVYVGIEGGVSRATNADVKPDWANRDTYYGAYTWAPDGTNYHINLGSAANMGVKIGYAINQLIKLDLAYNYRGNFSAMNANPPSPRSAAQETEAYGYPGTGYVTTIQGVHSQAIMLNINLFPDFQLTSFKPFCFGGIGVARNKISSVTIHSLVLKSQPDYSLDTLYGDTKTSLTWQIGVGIDYILTKNIDIGLAYRFVDMGNFTTGRYSDAIGLNTQPYVIKNLGVNECYLRLNYNF